ncbi:MAG: beta-ketoacyl-ACP synthase 3 [Sciscionella sp.]
MGDIRARDKVAGACLLGVGTYQPDAELDNEELGTRFGRTAQWVRSRTGMDSRRIAAEHETLHSMSAAAARRALDASGVEASQLGLVIVASCTNANPVAPVATTTAAALGAERAGAFDLNSACAGFCYALTLAADTVCTGSARYVLVVGAERMSGWIDRDDLGTSIIFGDGAGAVVVGGTQRQGIGRVAWGSDGSKSSLIRIDGAEGHMRMDGQSVFRWATTQVAPTALKACEQAGVQPEELAAVVPHQANLRIVDALAQRIGARNAVVARDGTHSGNTSAASIPIALHRLIRTEAVTPGDLALLIGYGAGLTYAAQVIRIP